MRYVVIPLTVWCIVVAAGTRAAEPPNVVLVMADDQGWGDMAYNGHPQLKTPNFDALAREGLRFDRFHAAAPVCSPTRGSVMTGRHPNRFGCFQWGHPLRPQEVTIAEALKQAGYRTGHFGKWHLGGVQQASPVSPGTKGFDVWVSSPNFFDLDPILSDGGKAVPFKGTAPTSPPIWPSNSSATAPPRSNGSSRWSGSARRTRRTRRKNGWRNCTPPSARAASQPTRRSSSPTPARSA